MKRRGAGLVFVLMFLFSVTGGASAAWAAVDKDAALIVDGVTGKALYERDADEKRYPASLTKVMTLYLLFEQLKEGKLTLDSKIRVSKHATVQAPTKLGIKAGETIPVELAIKAIVVRSANDVAVTVAEAIGGTEANFAKLMTAKAEQLGMTHTNFANASGLPNKNQFTTARDLALLARHVAYDFPQYYPYFSVESFTYKDRQYGGHNYLLNEFSGTDGIKTGYTAASGFNLISSVVRGNHHVIGVVMGGRTANERDKEMMRLLGDTFTSIENQPTLVAVANVPWRSTAGQKTQPFGGAADANILLAQAAKPATTASLNNASLNNASLNNASLNTASVAATAVAAVAVSNTPVATVAVNTTPVVTTALNTAIVPNPKPILAAANSVALATVSAPIAKPVAAKPAASTANVRVASLDTGAQSRGQSSVLEQGDVGGPSYKVQATPKSEKATRLKNWAIQIGAFADQTTARVQLARYAEKSVELVGQASRLVIAFAGADGHPLYRARFGLFAENEAREICKRMAQRGQTCFATRV
jgi:D-alanyl-D-alanine carboxypeptidase